MLEQLRKQAGDKAALWALGLQAGAALMGFMLAGGRVFGGLSPFGLALVMGLDRTLVPAAGLGALVGSLIWLPPVDALRCIGALAAALGGRLLVPKKRWAGMAAGAGCLLAVQLILILCGLGSLPEACVALGEAALSAGLGALLLRRESGAALLAVGGVLPAAEYRLLALLPGLLPRVPAANRFAQVFLSLLLPLLFLIALSEDWSTSTEPQTAPAKGRSALAWAATALPCLVLIAFFAGWLPAYPTAIATGSMEPEIQIGDMVVMARWGLGDIQPGDVIAVERQGRTIVHRVVEVRQEAGETLYIPQGDANNAPDEEPAAQSQVEGRMIGLVPAVGRISLWFHTSG